MKNIMTTLLALLTSLTANAGNGGGTMNLLSMDMTDRSFQLDTGMQAAPAARQPAIVYYLGEQNGYVRFAYGRLVNGQWQTRKVQLSISELGRHQDVVRALRSSRIDNGWTRIH